MSEPLSMRAPSSGRSSVLRDLPPSGISRFLRFPAFWDFPLRAGFWKAEPLRAGPRRPKGASGAISCDLPMSCPASKGFALSRSRTLKNAVTFRAKPLRRQGKQHCCVREKRKHLVPLRLSAISQRHFQHPARIRASPRRRDCLQRFSSTGTRSQR